MLGVSDIDQQLPDTNPTFEILIKQSTELAR
jgi:hypothetical protein